MTLTLKSSQNHEYINPHKFIMSIYFLTLQEQYPFLTVFGLIQSFLSKFTMLQFTHEVTQGCLQYSEIFNNAHGLNPLLVGGSLESP